MEKDSKYNMGREEERIELNLFKCLKPAGIGGFLAGTSKDKEKEQEGRESIDKTVNYLWEMARKNVDKRLKERSLYLNKEPREEILEEYKSLVDKFLIKPVQDQPKEKKEGLDYKELGYKEY